MSGAASTSGGGRPVGELAGRLLLVALATAAGCSTPRATATSAPRLQDAGTGPQQPAPPSPEDPGRLAGRLRLADLLPLLLERSPRIRAARARLEAAAERYPQAIALPDPMAEVQYYTENAMADGASFPRYDLMIRQDFPFPTVLILRGEAATKSAEAEALRYEAAVRDAVAELKDAHAERTYLGQAARVQAAIRDVYRRYAELARGDVEQGRTRLAESFRAEALLAQADYELTLLAEIRAAEDQRLRSLLALPRGTPLGEPSDAAPSVPLDLDIDALAERAAARNQELRAAGVEVDVAEIGERLARWTYAPTFSIGAGRMINDEFDMGTGDKRDSSVVSFSLTIPLQVAAKSAAVREAEATARAARAAEAGERERVAAEVSRLGFRLRNAARLSVLYGRELVPQAERALLRSQSMMQEGKESLSSSLELAATWQQLRIAELRSRADEAQSIAALERVLGASLELVPSEAEAGPR